MDSSWLVGPPSTISSGFSSPLIDPIHPLLLNPYFKYLSKSPHKLACLRLSAHKFHPFPRNFQMADDLETMEQSSYDDTSSVDSSEDASRDMKILEFTEDEETLITRMFKLVGERWSLIAGRIPGRSAQEIEKYWTSRYTSTEQ